jgi:hypothetical protein
MLRFYSIAQWAVLLCKRTVVERKNNALFNGDFCGRRQQLKVEESSQVEVGRLAGILAGYIPAF